MTKQEKLKEIYTQLSNMILSGVLLKNVKRHLINLGVNEDLAIKMVKIAEFEANSFRMGLAK